MDYYFPTTNSVIKIEGYDLLPAEAQDLRCVVSQTDADFFNREELESVQNSLTHKLHHLYTNLFQNTDLYNTKVLLSKLTPPLGIGISGQSYGLCFYTISIIAILEKFHLDIILDYMDVIITGKLSNETHWNQLLPVDDIEDKIIHTIENFTSNSRENRNVLFICIGNSIDVKKIRKNLEQKSIPTTFDQDKFEKSKNDFVLQFGKENQTIRVRSIQTTSEIFEELLGPKWEQTLKKLNPRNANPYEKIKFVVNVFYKMVLSISLILVFVAFMFNDNNKGKGSDNKNEQPKPKVSNTTIMDFLNDPKAIINENVIFPLKELSDDQNTEKSDNQSNTPNNSSSQNNFFTFIKDNFISFVKEVKQIVMIPIETITKLFVKKSNDEEPKVTQLEVKPEPIPEPKEVLRKRKLPYFDNRMKLPNEISKSKLGQYESEDLNFLEENTLLTEYGDEDKKFYSVWSEYLGIVNYEEAEKKCKELKMLIPNKNIITSFYEKSWTNDFPIDKEKAYFGYWVIDPNLNRHPNYFNSSNARKLRCFKSKKTKLDEISSETE